MAVVDLCPAVQPALQVWFMPVHDGCIFAWLLLYALTLVKCLCTNV